MNIFKLIFPALVAVTTMSCSQSTTSTGTKEVSDSTQNQKDIALIAKMSLPSTSKLGAILEMTFTVYNTTDSVKTFCKWHTPFEPLLSKYLDITTDIGPEPAYKGPMAKRIMPPPADSYISIKPGDSLSVKVDISKAYDIATPGLHKVHYNSEGISGLKVQDTAFTLEK